MRLPRDVHGADLAAALVRHFGYRKVHQVGSHIILQTEDPAHRRLAVPDHSPVRLGTLNAIVRAVAEAKGVSRDDVLRALG